MEKRKITISVGRQACSFYSDDSEEYIALLEQRVNEAMKQTAGVSGSNAAPAVIYLADRILRMEAEARDSEKPPKEEQPRKNAAKVPAKAVRNDAGQISVWELLEKERKGNTQKSPPLKREDGKNT